MKKGLKTLLVATVLSCATAAFAAAPTIGTIPDIRIGDQEPPEALLHTDANFFVFTNAFSFDEKVTDADTPKADLYWSFDEGDNPVTGNVADGRWFQVNGIDSVHLGSADMATCETGGFADHVTPTNDLRDADPTGFATFRDVILSPLVPGTLPFDDANVQANAAAHGQGKVVRFVVSDGQNVDHKDILVKSVDDSTDEASGAGIVVYDDDTFDTQETGGWTTFGATLAATTANVCDYANGAYRVRTFTVPTSRYHSAGWFQDRIVGTDIKWVPYSSIGSDNYVRGKFYMYAAPGSEGWGNDLNNIPGFEVRLAHRYMYTARQLVDFNDAVTPYTMELRPSTDANNPSIYRVDFDPVDVPFWNEASNAGEGVGAGFETWELDADKRGYICLTELVTGTYPKGLLSSPKWTENLTTITGGTSVNGNFIKPTGGGNPDDKGTGDTSPGGMITLTADGSAIILNGAAVATDRIGSYYYEIPSLAATLRTRVAENELYRVRFHITSTQATTAQANTWLSVRSIGYGYVTYVMMSEGTYSATAKQELTQAIPGVGCLNPDKEPGDTNGGWYTVIQNTPMSMDIAADRSGATLADRMPLISAFPERGLENPVGVINRRDLRVGVQMYDALAAESPLPALPVSGYLRVDRVLIETFDQIAD